MVEWAEKALAMLPAEHLLIEMSFLSDTSRSLSLKARGQRYLEMLAQLNNIRRTKETRGEARRTV